MKIVLREARVRAALVLECAWRRKMAYELAGEAMWQLRQRKHRAAAVVQDATRRKLAHNALRRKLCWRRAAATLLAAHERGRSSRRAFGAARGASTLLAALSRRKVAMEQFRVAVAAAVTLQRRARGRSGRLGSVVEKYSAQPTRRAAHTHDMPGAAVDRGGHIRPDAAHGRARGGRPARAAFGVCGDIRWCPALSPWR